MTARTFDGGNGVSGNLAGRFNDFSDGEAEAVAEVVDKRRLSTECVQGEHMGVGDIDDVNVVANAGAVFGVVVGAIDVDGVALTERNLKDDRNQVRLGFMRLTEVPSGSGSVEITQAG